MQIVKWAALVVISVFWGIQGFASAQASEKGMATIVYAKKLLPADRASAIEQAKQNALERYFAGTSASRQQLFNSAKPSIMASNDLYISNWVLISEQQDSSAHAYQVVVRADINETKLDLDLAQYSPVLQGAGNASIVAVVFVARSPNSIQEFDARRYERTDVRVAVQNDGSYRQDGVESERIRSDSISTSDSYSGTSEANSKATATVEMGGSTTRKADKISWAIAQSSGIDQQITGILADRGVDVVPSEFIENLDLAAVRNDFGSGDDLSPQTLRALVSSVKSNDIPMLLLGTLDSELSDTDPMSGNVRSHVMVNGRILDVTGKFPRVVSSIGPIQFAGIGPTETVARTNAMKAAAEEVAMRLVDDFAVRAGN